ncbi:MAG: ion transporter [Verrucomicrobiota bacterium]|nr:ion transporter [Verrucomicrobiota bacterium]
MTDYCHRIASSPAFQRFIVVVILFASVLVGIQTYKDFAARHAPLLNALDAVVLGLFTIEVIIKILAEGSRPMNYFRNPWNLFDFLIVAACLLEPLLPINGAFLPVIRLARILRVLRLVTVIPKLQILVGCLLKSLPSMAYVSILLFLLFYAYGAMAVFLYGENDPIHFRNLQTSILSLFRVATLEDWTDIMYINMYGSDSYGYTPQDIQEWQPVPSSSPLGAALFFVSFVLMGTMVILNLVIGVIMSSMEDMKAEVSLQEEMKRRQRETPDPVREGIGDLHARMEELAREMNVIKEMIRGKSASK